MFNSGESSSFLNPWETSISSNVATIHNIEDFSRPATPEKSSDGLSGEWSKNIKNQKNLSNLWESFNYKLPINYKNKNKHTQTDVNKRKEKLFT